MEHDTITTELIRRVVEHDRAAWTALQELLQAPILRFAAGHKQLRKRGLNGAGDDHVRNVLVFALERLARNDFRNLQRFLQTLDQHPDGSFESWLYVLVDYAVQDYLRQLYGPAPDAPDGAGGASRRDVNSFARRIEGDELPLALLAGITNKLTARQVLEHAQRELSPDELECLYLYLEGLDYDELANRLALGDAKRAEQRVRAIKERLRSMFRD